MSASIPIPFSTSANVAVSVSPTSTNIHERFRQPSGGLSLNVRLPKVLHPVDNEGLKLLLLENISQEAVKTFQAQGFTVDHSTKAMSEDELIAKISQYHAIGIRSKTKITEKVIKAASKVRI